MSALFGGFVAIYALGPVLRVGILGLIIVLYSRSLGVDIGVSAGTDMGSIPPGITGRLRYRCGILVGMTAGQLGNRLFHCIAALGAGEFYDSLCLFRCVLRYLALAEDMRLGIQFVIASVTAYGPVLVFVMLKLA